MTNKDDAATTGRRIEGWSCDVRCNADQHGCQAWYLCSDEQRAACAVEKACAWSAEVSISIEESEQDYQQCRRYVAVLFDDAGDNAHE